MLTCLYCGNKSINEPMYAVRRKENRKWVTIGHCCDDCYNKGAKLYFEEEYNKKMK